MVSRTKWVHWITIAITVLGLLALATTRRDLHPPFEFNLIVVDVTLPDASPAEVERLITYPIEEKLLKISGLDQIRSTSMVGRSRIRLNFKDEVKDLQSKTEEIRGKVQTVLNDLPSGITRVQVEADKSDSEELFLANYAILGVDQKNHQHHQFLNEMKRKLLAIPGVTKVDSSLRPLQPYIIFDPKKLREYRISPSTIRHAVRTHYNFQSVSYYNNQGNEWLIEMDRAAVTPEQIKKIPLFANAQGNGLTVGDVTQVEWRQPPLSSYDFLLDGKDAIELVLFKDSVTDSISLFETVKKNMAELKFPEGVTTQLLYDGPYFIQQQISVLISNGTGGLLLVLVMLALAMSWRTSLMTALGLPISYFGTFIILRALGFSIDLISLIAMILVVGNLVDDAVIMAERYTQLLEEGLSPTDSATTAAKELMLPVTGTILTIICAFLPMLFVEGNLSKIFAVLPIVIGAALFLSWFETFFILPNHLAHYVKTPPRMGSQQFFHHLARYYRRALSHTLKFRYLYAVASIALLVFTVITASKMPQNFNISVNAPQVEIFAEFPDGTTLEQAKQKLAILNEKFKVFSKDQLDFTETNQGWVWRQGKSYKGPKYAVLRMVINKEVSDPAVVRDEVYASVKKIIEEVKASEKAFVKLEASANERGGGNRVSETTTVKISGKDESAFAKAEHELIQALANKGNVGSYILPDDHSPLTFRFKPLQDRITSLQLSLEEVAFQMRAQTSAVSLIDTRTRGEWTSIMMEPKSLTTPKIEDLNGLSLSHPERQSVVPLHYLGSWQELPSSSGISHEKGERILRVQFQFDSKKTNEQVVKKELDELLVPFQAKYPQLKIETQDSNEADKKGREWTMKIVLLAGILIFLILSFVLKSFFLPLIVGLPIPFAMVGVIWALKLHDMPLALMSMIGLIGTMGVAVNDSIVMVDQIQRLRRKYGKLTKEIILDGAASRLRAISLTATCTLIGVFPTAYGLGGESGFTQPLAFSMGWGLSTSLLLTLFIIPSMLQVFEDISLFAAKHSGRLKFKTKTIVTKPLSSKDLPMPELPASDLGQAPSKEAPGTNSMVE